MELINLERHGDAFSGVGNRASVENPDRVRLQRVLETYANDDSCSHEGGKRAPRSGDAF